MRRITFSLGLLCMVGCGGSGASDTDLLAGNDPAGGKADNSSGEGAGPREGGRYTCSSPLFDQIAAAASAVARAGTVPLDQLVTTRNVADLDALLDGPEIFPAMATLIEEAEHEIDFQTYVWDENSDAARVLVKAMGRLSARRKEMGATEPIVARFLIDASSIGFTSAPLTDSLPTIHASLEAEGVEPAFIRVETAAYTHLLYGNLHVKTLVVDGRAAILTGANPQPQHDVAHPWRDVGYRLGGDVARALLMDFDAAWEGRVLWTCGSMRPRRQGPDDENYFPPDCTARTTRLEHHLPDLSVARTACLPMLIASRQSDAGLFSNSVANPQDQAFLAAFASAKRRIRIQSPNFNDDAARDGLVAAALRGVKVEMVLSKKFNNFTESLGQGGTNEANVEKLHRALQERGAEDPCRSIEVRWYSLDGKVAIEGNVEYASHVKYLSIDDEVAIVGTANMDTQSWNNSREVNLAIDNAEITAAWDAQIFSPSFERGIAAECGIE